MTNLLEDLINNYYVGYINKNISIIILDCGGYIRFSTELASATWGGVTSKDIIGVNSLELNVSKDILSGTESIRQFVITNKTVVSYLVITANDSFKKHGIFGIRCLHIPLFKNNEIIGTKIIFDNYNYVALPDLISGKNISVDPDIITTLSLSPREHGVAFLLANGFTQSEIAKVCNLSRGAISTMIYKIIANKLKLNGMNEDISLIQYVRNLSIHRIIPNFLIHDCIITTFTHSFQK